MAHKDWCGKPCADCETLYALDEASVLCPICYEKKGVHKNE